MARLATALEDGSFQRLQATYAPRPGDGPEKLLARVIELKAGPHLSCTFRHARRDVVKNAPLAEAVTFFRAELPHLRSALLSTAQRDWQLVLTPRKPARLIQHAAGPVSAPSTSHDHRKSSHLDAAATGWLHGLGLTERSGQVRPSMADKFHQVDRYLDILAQLVGDSPALAASDADPRPLQVADMGCGKGHLTFGAWHLLRKLTPRPIAVVGVEVRPALVEAANALARQVSASGLSFQAGTIADVPFSSLDILVALHACNTATDEAILCGVRAQASLILVAPCCYQEIRPQLQAPPPLSALQTQGLLTERLSEWLTDSVRALHLRWAGYRVKMLEFVASEHTPKNLLIAAVREHAPFRDPAHRQAIEDLKAFFNVQRQALDPLLSELPRS